MSLSFEEKKHISDMLTSWLTILAIGIGGFWAILQYVENQKKNRVQETLKYVHIYNSGEMHKAQRTIARFWDVNSTGYQVAEEEADLEKSDRAIAQFIVTKLLKESHKPTEMSIWLVVDFYESLMVCVSQKLCDQDTALAFFGEQAIYDYNSFHHYFEFVRGTSAYFNYDQPGDKNYALEFYQFTKLSSEQ
ncbi:hypothetical protein [Vibrio sp. RE88]|uniref:DUF4760 domain-containing protein n=1 Tax=Vibrio sp. RE88 TaxID=2607610 RepID=UPI001493D43D|nr:hypothetical protein [Vibrio sp. RE88]NOH61143.1 hypothetical protein [Vibrio sp. RE88]